MSESERRRKYRWDRVLIESARVLDPQFDDAVVYLTGSQIEMLRNMTQYLNRLDTYVSEQFLDYYLAPTVEDYDSILAIVADLEEKLMGNLNTIWGYHERCVEVVTQVVSGAGNLWALLDPVPEGEVWVLEDCYAYHDAGAPVDLNLYAIAEGEYYSYFWAPAAAAVMYHRWQGRLVLSGGDRAGAIIESPGDGTRLTLYAWGYKMDVPA